MKEQSMLAIMAVSLVVQTAAQSAQAQETNSTVFKSPYLNDQPEQTGTPLPKKRFRPVNLSVPQLEQHMLELVNQDRAQNGAGSVRISPALSKLARDLADDLIAHDLFSHTDSHGLGTVARAKAHGINVGVYENLGDQDGPESAIEMVGMLEQSFMSEPPNERNHRYILLLSTHRYCGIGVAKSKRHVIVVQEYTDQEPEPLDRRSN